MRRFNIFGGKHGGVYRMTAMHERVPVGYRLAVLRLDAQETLNKPKDE